MDKATQTIGQQIIDAYATVEAPQEHADLFGEASTMLDSVKVADFEKYLQAVRDEAREAAMLDAIARVLTVVNNLPGGAKLARHIHKNRVTIIREVPAYVHQKPEKPSAE